MDIPGNYQLSDIKDDYLTKIDAVIAFYTSHSISKTNQQVESFQAKHQNLHRGHKYVGSKFEYRTLLKIGGAKPLTLYYQPNLISKKGLPGSLHNKVFLFCFVLK